MDALAEQKGRIGVVLDGRFSTEVNIAELIDRNVSAEDVYGIGSPQAADADDLQKAEEDEKSEYTDDNSSENNSSENNFDEPLIDENIDRRRGLDNRYIANRRAIDEGSKNLKHFAEHDRKDDYIAELEKQIKYREELLERYSYMNDPEDEESAEKVEEDVICTDSNSVKSRKSTASRHRNSVKKKAAGK